MPGSAAPGSSSTGYEPGPDSALPATSGRRPQPPRETRPPGSAYAHNMEDILLDRMFRGRKGTYINVGADHPTLNNNTYYFLPPRGWRGVNAEPVRYEAFRPLRGEAARRTSTSRSPSPIRMGVRHLL